MTPLSIEISAFGAFGAVQRVDFTSLFGHGPFLIWGETGAGKTTIFDAISYALYGEMSGEIRTKSGVRSDFAAADTKTYVNLIFSLGGERHSIYRAPAFARLKKRGDGFVEEGGKVEFTLPSGDVLSDDKSVKARIYQLLGLTHSQWKQVAMIAQGEFMNSLHANPKERAEIFRNTFKTAIYGTLADRLKLDEKALKLRYDSAMASIFQYLSGIRCDVDSPHYAAISESGKTIESAKAVKSALEQLLRDGEHQLEIVSRQSNAAAETLDKLSKQLEAAKILNENIMNLQAETRTKSELDSLNDSMQEKFAFIKKAEMINNEILPLWNVYENYSKELARVTEEATGYSAFIVANTDKVRQFKVDFDNAETKSELREKLAAELKSLADSASKYDEAAKMEKEAAALRESIKLSEEFLRRKEKNTDSILKKNILTKTITNIEKYNQLAAEYKSIRGQYTTMSAAYEKAREAAAAMQDLFLRGQAGILAQSLVDGKPCPVCGAVEHPRKAVLHDIVPTKAEVDAKGKELSKLFEAVGEKAAALSAKEAEGKAQKDNLIAAFAEISDSEETDISKINVYVKKQSDELEAIIASLNLPAYEKKAQAKTDDELSELKSRMEQRIGSINEIKSTLRFALKSDAQKEIDVLKKQSDSLKAQHEAAKKLYETLNSEMEVKTALLANSKKRRAELDAAVKNSKTSYEEKLAARGLSHSEIQEYSREFDSLKIEGCKTEIEQYNVRVVQVNTKIETLTKAVNGGVLVDLRKSVLDIQTLQAEKKKLDEKNTEISTTNTINRNIINSVSIAIKDTDSIIEKYGTVSILSKVANGNVNGKPKITFESYIQRVYFTKVLKAANMRLTEMTRGQFELLVKQSAKSLKETAFALDIDCLDNATGKIRDVNSLSGGESFIAALALALGLADIIQQEEGGVFLETMFIDEGFGSLSDRYLESVMDVLLGLSANKNIGLISHVETLKDRIERQIVVEKKGVGGSEIFIKR